MASIQEEEKVKIFTLTYLKAKMATLISKFHLRFNILRAMSQSYLHAHNHLLEDYGNIKRNCTYFLISNYEIRKLTTGDRCMIYF